MDVQSYHLLMNGGAKLPFWKCWQLRTVKRHEKQDREDAIEYAVKAMVPIPKSVDAIN